MDIYDTKNQNLKPAGPILEKIYDIAWSTNGERSATVQRHRHRENLKVSPSDQRTGVGAKDAYAFKNSGNKFNSDRHIQLSF